MKISWAFCPANCSIYRILILLLTIWWYREYVTNKNFFGTWARSWSILFNHFAILSKSWKKVFMLCMWLYLNSRELSNLLGCMWRFNGNRECFWMREGSLYLQGVFNLILLIFSTKMKNKLLQTRGVFFQENFNVKKLLVGRASFFILVLKMGRDG